MPAKDKLVVYKGRDITTMSKMELSIALALTIKELHRSRCEHTDFIKRIAAMVNTSEIGHKLDKLSLNKNED